MYDGLRPGLKTRVTAVEAMPGILKVLCARIRLKSARIVFPISERTFLHGGRG